MREWTAADILRALHWQTFKGAVICVPNCYHTGYECDLLVVRESLKLIDVEVKISRSDLKADVKKDKWWDHENHRWGDPRRRDTARPWPIKIWKHYYAMPADIWKPELADCIPANSGILLLKHSSDPELMMNVETKRRAKVNPDAPTMTVDDLRKIAYLANTRQIEAQKRMHGFQQEVAYLTKQLDRETIASA